MQTRVKGLYPKLEGGLRMTVQMEPETLEVIIDRLRRELDHRDAQCKTAHAMAMDWRRRALTAEEQGRRLRAKYDRLRQRKGVTDAADTEEDPEDAGGVATLIAGGPSSRKSTTTFTAPGSVGFLT